MNSTIKDVAKLAGVSTATVSRVLNGNYPVSEDVRRRVVTVVEHLQYRPNQVARSLKRNRTNLIGLVVADIANPFFMHVCKGLEATISAKDYNLIVCSTNESPQKEADIVDMLIEKKVDAIAISVCSLESSVIKSILTSRIKVALIDRKVKLNDVAVDCITSDNFNGAVVLTEYLIQKGHRDIGIMNGILSTSTAVDRYDGFKQAMHRHGLTIQKDFVLCGKYSKEAAYTEAVKLLHSDALPSALFCGNNVMAEGVMRAFKDNHIRIPEDVSLVCFGMLGNQELIVPQITCIDQSPFLMGQKAGEMLLSRLENVSNVVHSEIIVENAFIEGNSVNFQQ